MAIYLLNFISIPVYDLIFKKNKRLIIFLVSVQMFLILALRADTLGTDLPTYKFYFEYYETLPLLEILKGFRPIGGSAHDYGVESGYVLFNWIIAKSGLDFSAYLIIYAAIVVISSAIFIDRYCEDSALGLATFISLGGFVSLFAALRQSLGFAVLLFAIPALVKRKFWRYLLIVFIAGLFHQSLLIAILLYPLAKFKANKIFYLSIVLASLILVIFTPTLYNNIIFPILLKLGRYYYISDFAWNNMFAMMVFLALLIMEFFKQKNDSDNAMQCGYLMALPIQALAFYIPVFARLAGSVFMNFLCVLIPGTVYSFETRNQVFQAKTVAYVGLFAFYLYTLFNNDVLVPYIPFWAVAS